MGLFSLFKKAGAAREQPDPAAMRRDEEAARLNASSEAQQRQREIARATALKIDAIEAAMVSDIFNTPEPPWGSVPKRAPAPRGGPAQDGGQTLALLDQATTELLGDEALPSAALDAQNAPPVEEVALLYANGQLELAGQTLAASLAGAGNDRTVWWMLFDLYQLSGQQEAYDNLSIDYASKFETSPPAWIEAMAPLAADKAYSGVTPTVALAGQLDERLAPALERLDQLAGQHPVLRLELNRVTGATPAGCALLLASLKTVQARQCELTVVAAAELAVQIRAMLQVGQRGDSAACWLLLLELLQLLRREKDFEETSMDYCVTFEVSPPPYIATHKVATAARQHASTAADRFMLPAFIDGPCAELLGQIAAYPGQPLVFDCSRLRRIDYVAAGQLLDCLRALAREGRKIEFRDLNHLVAALLRLLAFSDIAKIFPHRY